MRFRQRGQAIFLAAVLLLLGISAVIYTTMSSTSVSIANRQADADIRSLVQARDALIGRAASDGSRPGSLPCPDTDDDGVAEIFVGSNCPSYIGRLPWRTLGLPDPRDASEERLWYMLSTRFRDNSAAEPINSDTKGDVTVYVGNGSTVLTNEAVAVIFAPGAAIENQIRDAANKNNVLNYLESTSGINNAIATGPYISAQPTATFNDRLLVITTADLMTLVEQRVARELRTVLQNYKTATGVYPWADCSDGVSDVTPSPSIVVDGSNRGRIPWQTAVPVNWGSGGVLPLPTWFLNNNWSWVIYYAVGKDYLEASGARCSTCEPGQTTLTVDGVPGKEVVILTTGPADAFRPSGTPADCPSVDWTRYLADGENNDNNNDRYITPPSPAYARDRIFTIP